MSCLKANDSFLYSQRMKEHMAWHRTYMGLGNSL